jgi:hypothetical protein
VILPPLVFPVRDDVASLCQYENRFSIAHLASYDHYAKYT